MGVTFTSTDGQVTFTAAIAGPQGPVGGVPDGGTTGQSLTKASNADQDTEWTTVAGGGGGTGVTMVHTIHGDPGPFAGVLDQSAITGPTLVDGDLILCADDLKIRSYLSSGTWTVDHTMAEGELVLIGYTGYSGGSELYDMSLWALDESGALALVAEAYSAYALSLIGALTASQVAVVASGFDGNLTITDTDMQAVAQKVDDLVLGGGSGDVVGPAGATDGRAVLFDGTTGKLVKQAAAAPMLVGDAPTAHTHDTIANVATGVILGRATAGSGDSEELSASSARTVLGLGTAALSATGDFAAASHNHAASAITSGTVDTARLGSGSASSTTYLRGDQTWATVSGGGSGDVVGPSSSVDGRAVLFDSTTGKLIKQAAAAPMLVGDVPCIGPVSASRLAGGGTTLRSSIVQMSDTGWSTLALATGRQLLTLTALETSTIATIGVVVSATALTAGQAIEIALYEDGTDGGPTTRNWVQSITIGTSTGFIEATSLSLAVVPGTTYWVGVLNPSGNAGTVTLRVSTPTVTRLAAMGNSNPNLVWDRTGQASSSSDLSAVQFRSTIALAEMGGAGTQFPIVGWS